MKNEWTDEPYQMISGSAEAEKRKYKKLIGKSGRTWLVALQEDAADNIYVSANPKENSHGYRGFRGFGGRTLTFTLEDDTTVELQGPWHSNSDALFGDTGYDVRNKYFTFGVIGLGREYRKGISGGVTITDVIYKDIDWALGTFDRIDKLAQELANKRKEPVMRFVKSKGGSSCGIVEPAGEIKNEN